MIWKDIMLTSYEQPLFNWKQTLSGIDVEKFKRQYLDPASGYVGVVRCPDREKCSPHECCGLNIRDLRRVVHNAFRDREFRFLKRM